MPQTFDRRLRVADSLKQALAKLLQGSSYDPRFTFVSVSTIEISKNYACAKIYVTILDDDKIEETIHALNKAAGYFRYQLAHCVNLRTTPKLHFYYDDTITRGQRISRLLSTSSKSNGE